MSARIEAAKRAVERFVRALEAGDRDSIATLLTADATWWLPGRLPVSGAYEGRDAVLDGFLAQGLSLYQPGTLKFDITGMIAEDSTVAVEWVARGLSASGKQYENYYHVLFEVEGERVRSVREYVDTLYVNEVLFA